MVLFDTVIKGGTVVDGARTPRYLADVGIKDGHVSRIGSINAGDGDRVLDASGLIVAPGFVDLHTHYDSQVYWDPWCTISGWHGVTSVAIGNCGFGFAPVKPEDRDRAMLTMTRNEAVPLACMKEGMPWDWETYPEFLDSIERTPKGVNMLSYVPLNPLVSYVMGIEAAKSRPATETEQDEMCRLFREAMEAGGCGFSAQIGAMSIQLDYDGTPMITNTMAEEDLLAFAGVLKEMGRGFIQLAFATPEFTERMADASGRPIIWNALAPATDQHGVAMPAYKNVIKWLDGANEEGRRIIAQSLTARVGLEFTLEDFNMFDTSPLWKDITMGTYPEKLEKMRGPARRKELRAEFDAGRGPLAGGGTEEMAGDVDIQLPGIGELIIEAVATPQFADFEGLTINELGRRTGKHPIDAMLDLVCDEELKTTFVTPQIEFDQQALRDVATARYAIPGASDGGAHTKFLTLGDYPTEFLTDIVRDGEMMDLEEAHWRLSAYPALTAGFRDRGTLREGAPADIVVYDFENLQVIPPLNEPAEVVHDFPGGEWRRVRRASGYRWTLVNGEITFEDGVCTQATPGKLLRHGQAGS